MLVALSKNKSRCHAWETEKPEKPFYCPECKNEVILRKGRIREHHFAHKPPVNCIYGHGESQLHLKAKREIFNALKIHPKCSKCEIERRLDGVRPDISLYIGKKPVAIEIQHTSIDLNEIRRRSKQYHNLGISLIWVIPSDGLEEIWHEGEEKYVCRLKEWQKFLHAMYYGRLYFWQKEAFVIPYHFHDFQIWVEENEWYDEYGDIQYSGGYHKTAKAFKIPIICPKYRLHIADDFTHKKCQSFSATNWTIPYCSLWLDSLRKWW